MNKITSEELLEHIEDDDFFETHGDPVLITLDGKPDIVCMSWELYRELVKEYDAVHMGRSYYDRLIRGLGITEPKIE